MNSIRKMSLLLSALVLLSFSFCSHASAYELTSEELIRLETNLTKLEQINKQSLLDLEIAQAKVRQSQMELAQAKEELEQAKNNSISLTKNLEVLQANSKAQENLLQIANQSLKELEKEQKREIARIKRERNSAILIAIASIVICFKN